MITLTDKQMEVLSTMQIERTVKSTAIKLNIPLTAVYSRIYKILNKTGYNIVYPEQLSKCAEKFGQSNYNRITSMSIEDMSDYMACHMQCSMCPAVKYCKDVNCCQKNIMAYLKAQI